MGKKINCKHGLTHKQEIEARRLKDKLLKLTTEPVPELSLWKNKWLENKEYQYSTFEQFLKRNNIVLYSALKRLHTKENDIYGEILNSVKY